MVESEVTLTNVSEVVTFLFALSSSGLFPFGDKNYSEEHPNRKKPGLSPVAQKKLRKSDDCR